MSLQRRTTSRRRWLSRTLARTSTSARHVGTCCSLPPAASSSSLAPTSNALSAVPKSPRLWITVQSIRVPMSPCGGGHHATSTSTSGLGGMPSRHERRAGSSLFNARWPVPVVTELTQLRAVSAWGRGAIRTPWPPIPSVRARRALVAREALSGAAERQISLARGDGGMSQIDEGLGARWKRRQLTQLGPPSQERGEGNEHMATC